LLLLDYLFFDLLFIYCNIYPVNPHWLLGQAKHSHLVVSIRRLGNGYGFTITECFHEAISFSTYTAKSNTPIII